MTNPRIYKINSRYLFLTYSRVEDSIDLKMILKALEKKLTFEFFAIGLHKHSDEKEHEKEHNDEKDNKGYSNHFHILLKKDNDSKQFRLKEFSLFDFSFNSSIYSADVKTLKNRKDPENVFNYIKRDSIEFETNFEFLLNEKGFVCSKDQFFIEQIKTLGFAKAIIEMDELDSEFVAKTASKYEKYDSILQKSKKRVNSELSSSKKPSIPRLDCFGFKVGNKTHETAYDIFLHYLEKGCGHEGLILSGFSGVGKSLFAKSFAREMCDVYKNEYGYKMAEPLMINDLDKLKDYDSDIHKILIFDDTDFKHLSREQRIHLLASHEESSDIRLRHLTVQIAPFTHRLFTTNDIESIINEEYPELMRRALIIFLDEPFVILEPERKREYEKEGIFKDRKGIEHKLKFLSKENISIYPLTIDNNLTINNNNNNITINNINIIIQGEKTPEELEKLIINELTNNFFNINKIDDFKMYEIENQSKENYEHGVKFRRRYKKSFY